MNKVKILGDAMVVESNLKLVDIKKLEKFRKDALVVLNPETKDEIFRMGTGTNASLTNFGVTFNGTGDNGVAIATLAIPAGLDADGKRKYVSENFTKALIELRDLEAVVAEILGEFNSDVAAVEENIEIL